MAVELAVCHSSINPNNTKVLVLRMFPHYALCVTGLLILYVETFKINQPIRDAHFQKSVK